MPPFPAPMKKPPFVVKERFFSRLAVHYFVFLYVSLCTLLQRLIDKSMSQVELAAVVGTTKGYINKIITGYRSGEKYLEHICRILEIDLAKYRDAA